MDPLCNICFYFHNFTNISSIPPCNRVRFGISRTGWFLGGFGTSFVAYLLFSNDDLCRNKNTLSVSASFLLILQRTTVHGFFLLVVFFFSLVSVPFCLLCCLFVFSLRCFGVYCRVSLVHLLCSFLLCTLMSYIYIYIYIILMARTAIFFLELSLFIVNFFQSPSWWYLPSVRCGVCCCMWTHLDRQFFILRHPAPLIFYSTYFGYFFWTIILCGDLVLKTASVEEPVPPSIGVGSFFFFFSNPLLENSKLADSGASQRFWAQSLNPVCPSLNVIFSDFSSSHCASTFF